MVPVSAHHELRALVLGEAWPEHAQPCLVLELALGIVVGDAGRDAHPAGRGARGPVAGVRLAVLPALWKKRNGCFA